MADVTSVAIVIVAYNVRQEIDACLRAVVSESDRVSATITVVDNRSTDGTTAIVREQWPQVSLIDAGRNIGFARANNLAIKATSSEFVLLLNPDTVVRPGTVGLLRSALADRSDAAVAGPRLVDREGRAELSFGWTMSPTGELYQKVIGGLYRRRLASVVRRVDHWTREAGEREWVSGACMMVRRRDLESVGLLDERFFMYTEDIDLCVSLRKRGRKILFVPSAEVVHLRGRSVGRNPRAARLRRQSHLAYYEKHHPRWLPLLRLYLQLTGKYVPNPRNPSA